MNDVASTPVRSCRLDGELAYGIAHDLNGDLSACLVGSGSIVAEPGAMPVTSPAASTAAIEGLSLAIDGSSLRGSPFRVRATAVSRSALPGNDRSRQRLDLQALDLRGSNIHLGVSGLPGDHSSDGDDSRRMEGDLARLIRTCEIEWRREPDGRLGLDGITGSVLGGCAEFHFLADVNVQRLGCDLHDCGSDRSG